MMFFRILITLLFCSVATITRADTSQSQAVACLDSMLAEAETGGSFSAMVQKYVSFAAVATRAVHIQKGLLWKNISDAERKPYVEAIKAYFAKEADKVSRGVGKSGYVKIETVKLRPNADKKVGTGYQLAGSYETQGGDSANFALYIAVVDGRCKIYDAQWKGAWLSKYVDLP